MDNDYVDVNTSVIKISSRTLLTGIENFKLVVCTQFKDAAHLFFTTA
jgi:hypothetical protein